MKREDKIEKEIRQIEKEIHGLYEKIYEKRPSHFHYRDIVNSFVGSLILGLTFIFKGSLVELTLSLTKAHLTYIILLTSVLLTFQIYFIGYSRVKQKDKRKFGQFWAKRFFTLYFISILVSFVLVYLFNVNHFAGDFYGVLKTVIAISMPCAVGAAIPGLLKHY